MLTTNFSTIEWKNGAIENPTYFIASNLNAINKSTKNALDELERELTGDNPLYSVLVVYKSLNLIPDEKNNNAVNPYGRISESTIGQNSIGLGHNNAATAKGSIAIGNNAIAEGENSIAIGSETRAQSSGVVRIGAGNIPANNFAVSIGAIETVEEGVSFGDSSISIGRNAKAVALNSVQFGKGNNNQPNSLQYLDQNIYRKITVSPETEGAPATVTNVFGAEVDDNTTNKFLGNSLGTTDTIGPSDNIRNIADIFEINSPTVKTSTNAINAIPVGKNGQDSFKKIYYLENENSLRTNIIDATDAEESIQRTLLIGINTSREEHNTISGKYIYLPSDDESNPLNIRQGDLLKIIIEDTGAYAIDGGIYEVYIQLGSLEAGHAYGVRFTNSAGRYVKSCILALEDNCLFFKSGTSTYFGQMTGTISTSSENIRFTYNGAETTTISDSALYPIIKKVYKVFE